MVSRRCLLAGLAASFVLVQPAPGATIHVPGDQPTIQAGLDAAAPGDVVLVASGTYEGPGNRDLDFGGKDVVLRSVVGADSTIIKPDGGGVRGFHFHSGETSNAVVEGFTVKGGGSVDEVGGGILCVNSSTEIRDCVFDSCWAGYGGGMAVIDASPTVLRCRIDGNHAYVGGGMYCLRSSPNIIRCSFHGNLNYGAGMFCFDSDPVLTECSFIENHAGGGAPGGGICAAAGSSLTLDFCSFVENDARDGAGIEVVESSASLTGCVFGRNLASYGGSGGGIHCDRSSLMLTGCILYGNSSLYGLGGAIYCWSSTVEIGHCTLHANRSGVPTGGGGGIYSSNGSLSIDDTIIAFSIHGEAVAGNAVLRCSDLYGNEGGDWVGEIAGQAGINGNFSAGPLFCNPANADFRLDESSPCAPGNTPAGCALVGALPVGCSGTAVVESSPPVSAPRLAVRPNPVRTAAEFTIDAVAGRPWLEIYDLRGRVVTRLGPTAQRILWSPDPSMPAGVYFARLSGGEASDGVKFLFLR